MVSKVIKSCTLANFKLQVKEKTADYRSPPHDFLLLIMESPLNDSFRAVRNSKVPNELLIISVSYKTPSCLDLPLFSCWFYWQ